MKLRSMLIESTAVAGFFILGMSLRIAQLDLEAVEQFDEGVYASVLWYDGQFHAPYPARQLFAPPLISTMMEFFSWIPGLARYAAFLPSVLLGIATIPAMWLLARSWFGKPAGIFIAAVVAMSDFHILYSRMALTDVACLFWIIAAVGLGTRAVSRQCFRTAAAAGFICGLAWWTKYTGWLPLAILCSGSGLWWLVQGRKSMSIMRLTGILATIIVVAVATFAPWWWQLRDVGGYQTVAATHASYVTGWSSWTKNLARQLSDQLLFDGLTGQLSLGLGLGIAALLRWTSGRSTWNVAPASSGPGSSGSTVATTLPPLTLMVRFMAAAIGLSIISIRIKTPLMLICIAVGGLSGIYLWPVLQRSWRRRELNDLSPTSPGALPLSAMDLECAPTIDPTLGFCTTVTWFVGMLLSTPMYAPFSRLFFPLLAAVWLAAAGGVAWWLESNLSVARRMVGTGETAPKRTWGQQLVSTMLGAAILSSFLQFDENRELEFVSKSDLFRTSLFADRTSIVAAADDIADACVHDAARMKMIVYVYGEPALLFHLNQTGVIAAPVSHLNLRDPGDRSPVIPTFVVFGPNAKRTPGFWEDLMQRSLHLRRVTTIRYSPGEVTLRDLFDPGWLKEHPEAASQTLEVHRVE